MKKLMRFFKDEEGVTAIEYGLIAALIAVVIITAVTLTGTNLRAVFNAVAQMQSRSFGTLVAATLIILLMVVMFCPKIRTSSPIRRGGLSSCQLS